MKLINCYNLIWENGFLLLVFLVRVIDYAQFDFPVRAACLEKDSQAVLLIQTPAVRALLTRSASQSFHKQNLLRPPSSPSHVLEEAAGVRTHSAPLLLTRVLPFHALLGPFPFRCPVRMNPRPAGCGGRCLRAGAAGTALLGLSARAAWQPCCLGLGRPRVTLVLAHRKRVPLSTPWGRLTSSRNGFPRQNGRN